MSLMPGFKPTEAQAEGLIIGTLMAGYGELEMEICGCLITSEYNFDMPVREVFGETGAEKPIERVKKLLKQDYTNAGLFAELSEALADMDYCRKIRNQYAHCQWYWTSKEGLCFVNLEDLAKQSGTITGLTKGKRPINVSLLKQQEAFFTYVKFRLRHIGDLYKAWDAKKAKGSRPAIHISPKQPKIAQPMMHN